MSEEYEVLKKNFQKRLKQMVGEDWGGQAAFARKVGVSRGAVTRWLRGERLPKTEELVKIASTMNVSIDHLLGRKSTITIQLKK